MSKELPSPVPPLTAGETEDREGGEGDCCPENQKSLEASAPATVPGPDPSLLEEKRSRRGASDDPRGPLPTPPPSPHTVQPPAPPPIGAGQPPPGPHGNTLPGGPQPPHRRAVHLAPSPPQLGGLRLSLLGTRLLSGGLHSSPAGDQSPGQQRQVPAPPGTTKMTNCWAREEVDQKPPGSTFRAEGRNTSPDQSSVTEDRKEQFSAASGVNFLETVDLGSRPPRSVNLVCYPVKQWWS